MCERSTWLNIAKQLTQEFPALIFWKHFDRGIVGAGDIDTLSPQHAVDAIATRVAEMVAESFPDTICAVRCLHARNVQPLFFVRTGAFPFLPEFDITYRPSRMLACWADPIRVLDFAIQDKNGVRVLKPGALAAVLLMLYGFNRAGHFRMKEHDWRDVQVGVSEDSQTAKLFARSVLPRPVTRPALAFIEALERSACSWDSALARRVWTALLWNGLCEVTLKPVLLLRHWRSQRLGWCLLGSTVHNHDRVVQNLTLDNFVLAMRGTEHVIVANSCRPVEWRGGGPIDGAVGAAPTTIHET